MSTITPNMSLPVPTVGQDPGPLWGTLLNQCMTLIDQHNHSSGSGSPLTSASLNITGDLDFNNFRAKNLKGVTLAAQVAAPANVTLYSDGVDLFYRDGTGFNIQVTDNNGVAGTPGSISNLVLPASASYIGASSKFKWESNTNIAANMDFGSAIMRNLSPNSTFALTLSPPTLSSDYTITLPPLPGSSLPMILAASGEISTSQITTLQIADSNITTAKLNNLAVTTAKLDNLSVTTAKIAASAVTANEIANATITGSKIAAATISGSNIASSTITGGNIASSTITQTNMAANSVGTSQIQASAVTLTRLAGISGFHGTQPVNGSTTSTSFGLVTLIPFAITTDRLVIISFEGQAGGADMSFTNPSKLRIRIVRNGAVVVGQFRADALTPVTLDFNPGAITTYELQIASTDGTLVSISSGTLKAVAI